MKNNDAKKSPFSTNLRNYIWATGITREELANKINQILNKMGKTEKVYSGNDVWTYDSRGSFPKDPMVAKAISKILEISLDELLTQKVLNTIIRENPSTRPARPTRR